MDLRLSALNLAQYPPARLIELARLQEACGYETFWYTDERFFREVYSGLTLAAMHTRDIKLGTMVTDPYTRHPALTAMAIATLDEVAEGRAVLGLGAGVAGFSEMHLVRRQPAQVIPGAFKLLAQFDLDKEQGSGGLATLRTLFLKASPKVNQGALFGLGGEYAALANAQEGNGGNDEAHDVVRHREQRRPRCRPVERAPQRATRVG